GRIRWNGLDVAGQHQPIVSETVFQQVSAVITGRTSYGRAKAPIGGFPLRAFATCATCRGRFTAERHGRLGYYRCSRQIYRRALCSARLCNADHIHADLERLLMRLQFSRQFADEVLQEVDHVLTERTASQARRDQELSEEHAALTRQEMRLTDA